jgi:hypothetical protein
MMPEKDLWPINDSIWNYLDGNGFHLMTTKYNEAVEQFGKSKSIEEYAQKAQLVGAMNFRAIWEVWDYNKFGYGDRWTSGFLFWYNNSPLPQTSSRLYDWYLEPTAALYYSQNGLAPLHPQFDYLKNTVSVYNDLNKSFNEYSVEATVYDLDSKVVSVKSAKVNIPADGVVNDALKLDFPATITQVHFIKLNLKNNLGKVVADAFYWRSKDAYKGAWTMTGPAVSGFQDLDKLAKVDLKVVTTTFSNKVKMFVSATVSNPSKTLAFFTQLKLQDGKDNNIAPLYYSDNFFSLLPGESKKINIEVPFSLFNSGKPVLITEAYNSNIVIKSVISGK